MFPKTLIPIIACVLFGGLVGAFTMWICIRANLFPYTGGGGAALPSPNADNAFIVIIEGFLSGIFGLLTSIATLMLVKQGFFLGLKARRVLLFAAVCGLIYSSIFAVLGYNNAIEGQRPPVVLDAFARKMIFRTAIVDLIIGCSVALVSVIVVTFFDEPAD